MSKEKSLYERLGGYDAIQAVVDNLLPRLRADLKLDRFWKNRGDDGVAREKQLLINYLCASAGGPILYTGRDNNVSHKGMAITAEDWSNFIGHLNNTLAHFNVPDGEKNEVLVFIESTRVDIVE